MTDALEKGREAFRQRNWAEAYHLLVSADRENRLNPDDLDQLARASYLAGNEADCADYWTRAHHEYLEQEDLCQAADCAFWLGMSYFNRGDNAQGSGWIARARRLINKYGLACSEQGFLLVPEALQHLRKGHAEHAEQLFIEAIELGNRFNNHDLTTLGTLGRGQSLIRQNNISKGTKLFDEAMIAVISDEISPIVAGIVYCAVIDTCQKIYDLQRAQEWTEALSRWCDSQPDLIPYRGQCLVRRAEIMQIHGKWPQAMIEVRRACEITSSSIPPATGEAFYRQAELYRVQGNFKEAEESYRQANKSGRNPQPGLALLRLAQGQTEAAKKAIEHVAEQREDQISRSKILPAYVEIMLAADKYDAAQSLAAELDKIADELKAPYLRALAARAEGHVLLSRDNFRAALTKLRDAWSLFNSFEASYESARTQKLIGLACRKLGDRDSAKIEFDSARSIFQQLGASPDIEIVNSLLRKTSEENVHSHGLTSRELEVLRILATGKTNKSIADNLYISERTVDRHVSNILAKLNVPSRAAATAYAYEHDLV